MCQSFSMASRKILLIIGLILLAGGALLLIAMLTTGASTATFGITAAEKAQCIIFDSTGVGHKTEDSPTTKAKCQQKENWLKWQGRFPADHLGTCYAPRPYGANFYKLLDCKDDRPNWSEWCVSTSNGQELCAKRQ